MNKYTLDYITALRIGTTLRLRINTLWERRRQSQKLLGTKWANNWFNSDIREAIDTYKKFRSARVD